jgi:hypothetical protein
MINDTFKIKGDLRIILRDTVTGEIKLDRLEKNLVVGTGKTFICSRMAGAGDAVMSHMAVGTDATTAANGDTTLVAEVARVALTVSGGTPSSNTVQYSATFGAGVGTGALQEAGILNAASGGTMLSRTTYAVVNKGAADEMIINWTITVG